MINVSLIKRFLSIIIDIGNTFDREFNNAYSFTCLHFVAHTTGCNGTCIYCKPEDHDFNISTRLKKTHKYKQRI